MVEQGQISISGKKDPCHVLFVKRNREYLRTPECREGGGDRLGRRNRLEIYVPGNRLPPAASLRTGEGRPGSGGGDAASQGGVFPLPTRHKRPNAVALTVHEPASSHQSIYSTRHWARHEKRRLPRFLTP